MTNLKTGARFSPALIGTATEQADEFDGGPNRHRGIVANGKELNENLAPLRRFLERQVGRPWDKVYSELRAGIDTRSAIGLHVMQHLPDFVQGVHGSRLSRRAGLYIDSRTGLLRRSAHRTDASWWDRRPDEKDRNFAPIGLLAAYVKEGGTWYKVEYRTNNPDELVLNQAGRWVLASDSAGFKARSVVSKIACDNSTIAAIYRGYVTNRKYYERTRPQSNSR